VSSGIEFDIRRVKVRKGGGGGGEGGRLCSLRLIVHRERARSGDFRYVKVEVVIIGRTTGQGRCSYIADPDPCIEIGRSISLDYGLQAAVIAVRTGRGVRMCVSVWIVTYPSLLCTGNCDCEVNFLIRREDNRDPEFRRSKVVTIHTYVINIIECPLRAKES